MQEDSRAAHLQALTPFFFFYFCPIMRHCVVHKYNVLYLVPTDWPTCWMDSSGPTFPFNLTASTTEIYPSFFFFFVVFKMDAREQLLQQAVSLTIMNVTWYSSKSIGCLPTRYIPSSY